MRIPTSATGSSLHGPRGWLASRRAGGFTLLELLAVIAIAALVLGVSAPAMQRLYQSAQYRGAVSDIVAALNGARISAIRTGEYQDVLIDPRARHITRGDEVRALPDSLELEVLGSRELNRDGSGVIRFFADGASSGGYVDVSHPAGMAVQIQVDWLLGRVTLCKKNCREA